MRDISILLKLNVRYKYDKDVRDDVDLCVLVDVNRGHSIFHPCKLRPSLI
jgi:hypothetical protein